jgi:hypothetical protein
MAEVTLRNMRKQPFLATMYHDIACRRRQSCSCAVAYVTGAKGKGVGLKSPASFQIDALSQASVDAAVLHLPQVKSALKDGWLVTVGAPAPVTPATTPTAAPGDAENGSRKGRR